jgi:hypothetical protein
MGEHNSDERTQHPWKSMAALANASMEKLAAAEQTSARQRERASMAAPRGIVAAPSWDFLHGVSERNAQSHGAMLEIEEDSTWVSPTGFSRNPTPRSLRRLRFFFKKRFLSFLLSLFN